MRISFPKLLATITLFTFLGAGFSYTPKAFANERFMLAKAETKKKTKKKQAKQSDEKKDEGDSLFLEEKTENKEYMPDIYRCPECGYEQDEPGFCPDHNKIELIKVLSKGKDPLAPTELDGNEDILVDIPLSNIKFKKKASDGEKETKKEKKK